MIIQLSPCIPVITPKGPGLAHFLIDDGIEHHLQWVCFLDSNSECWTFQNPDVRAQKNITHGRKHISPFYDPDDMAFPKITKPLPDEYDDPISYNKIVREIVAYPNVFCFTINFLKENIRFQLIDVIFDGKVEGTRIICGNEL